MSPRIAIGPTQPRRFVTAVTDGGGTPCAPDGPADGLVWLQFRDVDGLHRALDATGARWVQLPMAGVEDVHERGLFTAGPTWTSAKGAYAKPVAEHAMALGLAGLRLLPERVTARSWGDRGGAALYDTEVLVLGAGGITDELLRMLAGFHVRTTVVRRRPEPVAAAAATIGLDGLDAALPGKRLVILALALTDATRGVIAAPQLAAMDGDAWLVNVARGGHVVTSDLVAALEAGSIGGAALDVTDPEPLPDGHPLWGRPNCIITPHTADTPAMVAPLLAERVRANVAHLVAGEPFDGVVDPEHGY